MSPKKMLAAINNILRLFKGNFFIFSFDHRRKRVADTGTKRGKRGVEETRPNLSHELNF